MKIVWQTVRRIANEILGVKGLKHYVTYHCISQTLLAIDSGLMVTEAHLVPSLQSCIPNVNQSGS